jgi:hypothetical protein
MMQKRLEIELNEELINNRLRGKTLRLRRVNNTYSDDIGIAGGKKVVAGEELTNLVNDHS